MAKEESREKEMRRNIKLWQDTRYLGRYGMTKEQLEKEILKCLKFDSSFGVIENYLLAARDLIQCEKVRKCKQFIERAKYVLKGCKE